MAIQEEASTPTGLEQLDIVADSLALPTEAEVIALGGGLNSRVVRVGDQVLKASKPPAVPTAAHEHMQTLEREQQLLESYLGEHIPSTTYAVVASRKQPQLARVVTIQEHVEGVSLAEFTANPSVDPTHVVGFFERCLMMYRETKQVADVANIETRFNIFKNGNLVVPTKGSSAGIPSLVDTNFGRIQRSKALGPTWSYFIARGIRRGVKKFS